MDLVHSNQLLKIIFAFCEFGEGISLTPDVIVRRGMLCDVYTVHALYLQYISAIEFSATLPGVDTFSVSFVSFVSLRREFILYYTY